MLSNSLKKFKQSAKWSKALLFLALSQIVYFLMLLVTIPGVEAFAKDKKIFDLMPTGYSVSYALSLLDALGEEGRRYYVTVQIPLDVVYPALMAITGVLFIALLTQRGSPLYSYLMFLPCVAAAFDYLENALVATMLLFYPSLNVSTVQAASVASILKSVFTSLYVTVLVILMLRFFIQKRMVKNKSKQAIT